MIHVRPAAYLLAAALVLLLPLDWLLAAIFAAAVHEMGHLAAICILKGRIDSVTVGFLGARIHTGPLENRAEFLCAAAGPAASLLLLSLCRFFPKLAVCALVQGMFNLIPVHPMDGGRMLRCFLQWLCPRQAKRISDFAERLILCAFVVLSLILAIHHKEGLLPALVCVTILSRLLFTKIPCKSA